MAGVRALLRLGGQGVDRFRLAGNEIRTNRRVDFDTTVAAMRTATEMKSKYNETPEAARSSW